jgi:hypothetical protein
MATSLSKQSDDFLTGILTNTSSANVLIFTQAPAIKASK